MMNDDKTYHLGSCVAGDDEANVNQICDTFRIQIKEYNVNVVMGDDLRRYENFLTMKIDSGNLSSDAKRWLREECPGVQIDESKRHIQLPFNLTVEKDTVSGPFYQKVFICSLLIIASVAIFFS